MKLTLLAKRTVCILLSLTLYSPAYGGDIKVVEPVTEGLYIKVGKIVGVVLKVNEEGVYIRIKNEIGKFETHGDVETEKLIDRYRDQSWYKGSFLLFVPHSEIELIGSEAQEDQQELVNKRDSFECFLEGKYQARRISTGGSSAGGFFGGLLLALLGTGIAVLVQSSPDVPYSRIPEEGGTCRLAFIEGYQQEGMSKKRNAALVGGLIGTVVLVTVIVVASSSN